MQSGARVRVWDLPTRLFHWALALLAVCSVVTVKLGGLWMDWHMRSGYAILALVLFRILWGFAGSRYARFSDFLRPPSAVLGYLRGTVAHGAGHSPLGALSVVALLGLFLAQASTGLFANDGSFTEGPLAKFVSNAASERLSTIHRYGEWVLYSLVALHVGAIAYYTAFRRVPLVVPMITGDRVGADVPPADDGLAVRARALVLVTLCGGFVAWLVTR